MKHNIDLSKRENKNSLKVTIEFEIPSMWVELNKRHIKKKMNEDYSQKLGTAL